MSDRYVDQETWDQWEAARDARNRECAQLERETRWRRDLQSIPVLLDRIQELEVRLHLTELALAAALELHQRSAQVQALRRTTQATTGALDEPSELRAASPPI